MPIALYQVLGQMVTALTNHTFNVPKQKDGRTESTLWEDYVIDFLVENFPDVPQTIQEIRSWVDHVVMDCPLQIKITTGKSDNFSSAAAIAWTYSDRPVEETSLVTKPHLLDFLSKHGKENPDRDYSILCIRKDTGEARLFSLKGLRYLKPNASNPPFQIIWKKEWDDTSQPDTTNSYERLLRTLKATHAKKREQFLAEDAAARRLFGEDAFD